MPAKTLKVSELLKKNFPKNDAVKPNAINIKEKPRVKKIVFTTIKLLRVTSSLLYEVPEI